MTREALLAELMRLPVEERRAIAIAVLDDRTDDTATNPDIEAAWEIELTRRRKLLDAGKLKLYTWEQVRAELYDESDDEEADDEADDAENNAAAPGSVIRPATR